MKNNSLLSALCLLPLAYVLSLFVLSVLPVELRWSEADLWLAWSLPVAGGMGIVMTFASGERLRWRLVDAIVSLWALYVFVRVYVRHEWPCDTQGWKMTEMVLLYALLRMLLVRGRMIPASWLTGGIVAFGVYEALAGLWQLASGTSRHHLFAMTGSFLNPGPYSASVMMALTACMAVLGQNKEKSGKTDAEGNPLWRRMLPTAGLLLLTVLVSTWSRAAWMGCCVCGLWIYRDRYRKYRYGVWGLAAVLLMASYFVKQGSADGRIAIWASALSSWKPTPWIGVGLGGFPHACAEGMAKLWQTNPSSSLFASAGVVDYACNEWLKILVEQGVTGALLSAVLVVVVMCRLYKQSQPLFFSLLSLSVFSLLSYPFEMLPYRILVVMTAAWSASCPSAAYSHQHEPERRPVWKRTDVWTVLTILTVTSGAVALRIDRQWHSDREAALVMGSYEKAFIVDDFELLPDEADNPRFLFDFAMTLRKDQRYRDSNALLRMGTKASADPMFYVIMGNNYRDEGFHDRAERSYKKAFAVMPNRLYPLYQLMLMYEEMGEKKKCREMAARVMEMKPKVDSEATRDMKRKAKGLVYLQ